MKKISTLVFCCFFAVLSGQILTPLVDSIPMRDGKKLAADIYIPSGCTTCPVVLVKTPYNRLLYRIAGLPLKIGKNVNASNYIFVIADWRGFYGSSAAVGSGTPDRGKDGYDCVQWIAQQSWSNGKVAMWGPSALGRVQFMTAKKNPPNLTCIVPLVAAPQYNYTEYFPGGVYRTEYVEQLDALGYGMSPALLANPVHNIIWQFAEAANFYPDSIAVPVLMIGGWYDHNVETMLSFFSAIQKSKQITVNNKHRLVMGPWVHGGSGTAQVGTAQQGQLSYPGAAGWNDSLALLFLDYYMRNSNNGWNTTPPVQYFQMGDDVWMQDSAWPPTNVNNLKLFFHSDNSMDAIPPSSNSNLFLSYPYNPLNPSPTVGGPTLHSTLNQGPYDQSVSVENRNDIISFTTAALTNDLVVKGSAKVFITFSSDKKDTDFSIRLCDVYPDGRSMLLSDGVKRARFINGYKASDTAAIIPNQLYQMEIDLPSSAITFKSGHRIRLSVSSSNYPRFNRNANNGGVMYPGNNGDSLINPQQALNKIYVDDLINYSYLSLSAVGSLSSNSTSEFLPEILSLYPNPANNTIHIIFNEVKNNLALKVYDVIGDCVISIHSNGVSTIALNVAELSPGIYFVVTSTGEKVKFVKQ